MTRNGLRWTSLNPFIYRFVHILCKPQTDFKTFFLSVLKFITNHHLLKKTLTSLDISECDERTERGVIPVARGCGKLERLAMEGCPDILTDEVAMAIARYLPQHGWLRASGCDGRTRAGTEALRRALPAQGVLGSMLPDVSWL